MREDEKKPQADYIELRQGDTVYLWRTTDYEYPGPGLKHIRRLTAAHLGPSRYTNMPDELVLIDGIEGSEQPGATAFNDASIKPDPDGITRIPKVIVSIPDHMRTTLELARPEEVDNFTKRGGRFSPVSVR